MIILGSILSWLGVSGVVLGLLAFWLVPTILPAIVVRAFSALADGLSELVRYVGTKLTAGGQVIFASGPATFTLIFAILLGGWLGDRYEFVRPYIPEWLQSEPGQVKAVRAKEAAKYRVKLKQQQKKATPVKRPERRSAWDEFKRVFTDAL